MSWSFLMEIMREDVASPHQGVQKVEFLPFISERSGRDAIMIAEDTPGSEIGHSDPEMLLWPAAPPPGTAAALKASFGKEASRHRSPIEWLAPVALIQLCADTIAAVWRAGTIV